MSQDQADISLLEFLDLSQLNCLNESTAHTLKSILQDKNMNTSDSYCESDADEQLLLTITFNQAVKVRSIVLKSTVQDKAPKSIKLLINRPSIGFEDVENASDKEVAQILELKLADIQSEQPIPLRFVRFQKVNSLHIFVASNQGGADESRIDGIDVLGIPVEATKDLSGLIPKEE
ncbi:DUF1000-domain-containing protein [Flagelloscypha sp. PMI_526]|nr:DUF1000-domain-containing protein [Flagelloscypha sp. PMI_526]